MKKINVIDLFSGCGGLSFGFHLNKLFNVIFANEIDSSIAETYRYNFKNTKMYVDNVANLTKNKILVDLKLDELKIDLVIGGPPCQAFSTLGKRNINDKRVYLFKEYLRIVKEFNPKIFLFENVKGLISMNNGKLFKMIIEEFEKLGYSICYKLINSADYGIPQIRNRVFIFGFKAEYQHWITQIDNLLDKYKSNKIVTVKDALSDLPLLKPSESSDKYLSEPLNKYQFFLREKNNINLTEHFSAKYSEKLMKIMQNLKEGETPKELPEALKPPSGYSNTYSRMWWDRPAYTITRNFTVPSSSRCIHPSDNRALTIREGARLQSFPDWFVFKGNVTKKRLQIGNAVPPLLSVNLSKIIREIFLT